MKMLLIKSSSKVLNLLLRYRLKPFGVITEIQICELAKVLRPNCCHGFVDTCKELQRNLLYLHLLHSPCCEFCNKSIFLFQGSDFALCVALLTNQYPVAGWAQLVA